MFKTLGILVCLYALYAAVRGRVYVKSGVWGRAVFRHDSPEYFWVAIAIYAGLGVALIAVF
jgi:hypothetical protein